MTTGLVFVLHFFLIDNNSHQFGSIKSTCVTNVGCHEYVGLFPLNSKISSVNSRTFSRVTMKGV